ncbi:2-hydroxyacid dehydrogenase [Aliiruegeria lutimaris]|uniref:Lactate dehydrogenase n=1 Tax=Aliiruegeria lutimaris TaxID=571298 RepID=A0A1G8R258_9RHOB|nr:2-hydroxyacid dehydrogenase [Aliiruegeria lutimaris]SDJ11074.1 Lactate dehydrogenase [Aliiruegeria lutimaris]
MSATIVIGPYSETDLAALNDAFAPTFLASPADLAGLDAATREGATAVAFKGHNAFDGDAMDLLPNLGLIANFGVGYDAIDVKAADARGIKVTNTPDVLNDDVADLAVALLLMRGREMEHATNWARSGQWKEKGEYRLNRKVSGGKAGIIGLGRIGREIANRLVAFKMDIHYFARSEKETPGWTYHADPVSLAKEVDYLIVALVGGPDTANFVSAEVLDALGPRGIIVNISRGSTIDEEALLDALEQDKIYGAALDVYLNEPDINPRFYALDNVVLQPHQGSGTVETRAAMAKLQRDNLVAYHAKEPLLTPVN